MANITEMETTNISVGISSGELLAPQPKRNFLHVQNNSANTILIRFGTSAAANNTTSIKLVSGAEMTFHTPGVGAIQAIALTATSDLTVTTNKTALS